MNLTNYKATSLRTVFDEVKKRSSSHGISVLESELVGLIPEEALKGVTAEYLQLSNFHAECVIETHL